MTREQERVMAAVLALYLAAGIAWTAALARMMRSAGLL